MMIAFLTGSATFNSEAHSHEYKESAVHRGAIGSLGWRRHRRVQAVLWPAVLPRFATLPSEVRAQERGEDENLGAFLAVVVFRPPVSQHWTRRRRGLGPARAWIPAATLSPTLLSLVLGRC